MRANNERLNVLLVTTSFPVESNRSSGVFIQRLAAALSTKVRLEVITPSSPAYSENHICNYPVSYFRYAPRKYQILAHNPGGIPVALRANRWNFFLLPGFIISLFFSVLRHGWGSDVIHANWSVPGLISAVAALIIQKPVITTLRGSDVHGIEASFTRRLIIKAVLKLSRKIVTVSNSIQEDLGERWPTIVHKIVVIPNGVDEELLRIKHCENNHGVVRLLTVGNLVANKDIATIIRAFSQVSDHARLTIAGDGEERPALEQLCKSLGVTDRIIFTGVVPPDRIMELLSKSDIFILASHSEGRPNAVLEAMAAGCAVVSSKLPGVLELIENEKQGLLFTPGDIHALLSILKKLVAEPEIVKQLGEHGRARIKNMGLTWDRCAEAYIRQYVKARFG